MTSCQNVTWLKIIQLVSKKTSPVAKVSDIVSNFKTRLTRKARLEGNVAQHNDTQHNEWHSASQYKSSTKHNYIQHNGRVLVYWVSICWMLQISVFAYCHYAECCYADCRYAECHGARVDPSNVKHPTRLHYDVSVKHSCLYCYRINYGCKIFYGSS